MIAYLAAFVTTVSFAVGALILLMVAYLTRATWFVPMRRPVEALAGTLPYFLLAYLPIAWNLHDLYPWSLPTSRAASRLSTAQQASLAHAHVWFSPAFFVARAYGYLIILSLFAIALLRTSHAQDRSANVSLGKRLRFLSASGLPITILTVSFAAFDWLMSLQPAWVSDAFGIYVGAGAFAGALGLVPVILIVAIRLGIIEHSAVTANQLHALGKVLFVAVFLWAYIGFCQFLLIWIADLPSEIPFYDDRSLGTWKWMSVMLVLTHFFPFVLLLSRPLKRRMSTLAGIGALVVLAHVIDVMWIVLPAAGHGLRVMDLLAVILATGGLLAVAILRYRAAPSLALHDPDRQAALRYESP